MYALMVFSDAKNGKKPCFGDWKSLMHPRHVSFYATALFLSLARLSSHLSTSHFNLVGFSFLSAITLYSNGTD